MAVAAEPRVSALPGQVWIQAATIASVIVLAAIAAAVSYGHMHALALQHGEGAWASALIPLSVDGMIVASSMSLLLDSRLGNRGGILPWTLLIAGALASLAANITVAEPTLVGRVIAAWPSFALTCSYELSPGVTWLSHHVAPTPLRRAFATHLVGVVLIVVAAQKPGQRGRATCTTISHGDGGWMTTPLPARSVETPTLHWS